MHVAYWGIQEMTSGNITWEQFENRFLGENPFTPEYTKWVISEQQRLNLTDVSDYFENRFLDSPDSGEAGVIHEEGGFDLTTADGVNLQEGNWQNISSVIPINKFFPFDGRNCYQISKSQIETMGYTTSNYNDVDSYGERQTINVYKKPNSDLLTLPEVNRTELQRGINYLHHALKRGIPVVVGGDVGPTTVQNADNQTTDHFITIVGMGNDLEGNYFLFYDGATRDVFLGTSSQNRLYFDNVSGKIQGEGRGRDTNGNRYHYIISMIRKSKLKKI